MVTAGIIGLGRMGAEPSKRLHGKVPSGWLPISHIESILSTQYLNLESISDINSERMDWVISNYDLNVEKFENPIYLIERKHDLLSIATRTQERYQLMLSALENNAKAIVIEKPLANSIRRANEIISKVEKNNIILGFGAARRAMDVYRQAKSIIGSGELGALKSIVAEFGIARLFWSLPHVIDLFLYFSNSYEFEYVAGHCEVEEKLLVNNKYDGDPFVQSATILFTNGIIASIVPNGGSSVRLGCENGILTIHGDGEYIEINKASKYDSYYTSSRIIENNSLNSGICNIYKAIANALNNKIPFDIIQPQEILFNQIILLGIIQSSINGGIRMSMKDLDEEFYVTGRSGNLYA